MIISILQVNIKVGWGRKFRWGGSSVKEVQLQRAIHTSSLPLKNATLVKINALPS